MAINIDRIKQLAAQWRNRTITQAGQQELDAWYTSFDDTTLHENTDEQPDELKDRLYASILEREQIGLRKPARVITIKRLSVAACITIAFSTAGWWGIQKHEQEQQHEAMAAIQSGGNRAVLTLANGQQVVLTGAHNGNIARQGNVVINKTADGKIAYAGVSSANGPTQYNTITTPRGGQYRVTLADGSEVLLNAESSLKYPVNFNGSERLVELSGEAYFEVVHNSAQPFRVKTQGQMIEDIGTHFNVNAYTDEAEARTTLLEGSVKVTPADATQAKVLKPGEQAVLNGATLIAAKTDVEEAVAWKDGYFKFNSEHITTIMHRIARWYNVDIVYDGPVPADKFDGTVNRFTDISHLLEKLELTDKVHFKIEGRRITVSR